MVKSKIDVKVVLLGWSSVGKTCIVQRLMYNQFGDTSTTIGGAFSSKRVSVGDVDVLLGIWDTAGTERYQAVNRSYYRRANAAIVCYDLTNYESWDKVKFWIDELTTNEPDIEIYIIGTKLDLVKDNTEPRAVPVDKVRELAERYHAHTYETSSKTGENIPELFQIIAENFCKKYPQGIVTSNNGNKSNSSVNLQDNNGGKKPSGGCC